MSADRLFEHTGLFFERLGDGSVMVYTKAGNDIETARVLAPGDWVRLIGTVSTKGIEGRFVDAAKFHCEEGK